MTFKNAAAGLALGGGKSVILRPSGSFDRKALFRAHGRFVETLNGAYITAEDVGSSPADMATVRQETRYAAGLLELSGDPSPVTAHGVFRAILGAAHYRWGSLSLVNRRVALQGCGSVGTHLARELARAGALLIVADVNRAAAGRLVHELGATEVDPRSIHASEADIFVPCALGGVLNAGTIPMLRCGIVAGAANNQLLEDQDAERLAARGILYVPDFIANAGGVINGAREILGWTREQAHARVDAIYETALTVIRHAAGEGITPALAAERLALERLAAA